MQTARLWQFEQVYVLVDGERAVDLTMPAIKTLLQKLTEFEQTHVYLKLFLPLGMEDAVKNALAHLGGGKLVDHVVVRLIWTEEGLRRLLRERFREAGSSREGFSDLVETEMMEVFDQELLTDAGRSPRKLLKLIQDVIRRHTRRPPVKRFITRQEWETTREQHEDIFNPPVAPTAGRAKTRRQPAPT